MNYVPTRVCPTYIEFTLVIYRGMILRKVLTVLHNIKMLLVMR